MSTFRNLSTPQTGSFSSPVEIRLGGGELDALGHGIYDINATYVDTISRLIDLCRHVCANPELFDEFNTQLRHPSSGMICEVPITPETIDGYITKWSVYVHQTSTDMDIPDSEWSSYIDQFAEIGEAIAQYSQIAESWKRIVPLIVTIDRLEQKWYAPGIEDAGDAGPQVIPAPARNRDQGYAELPSLVADESTDA